MSNLSRTKGRRGEQEVIRLLQENLIDCPELKRNYAEQAAEGGCDVIGLADWCIEIKRAKDDKNMSVWWEQCFKQALHVGKAPVLIYRIDGKGRGLPPLDKWRTRCEIESISDVDVYAIIDMRLRHWIDLVNQNYIESTPTE